MKVFLKVFAILFKILSEHFAIFVLNCLLSCVAVMYPRKHITHIDLESLSHNLSTFAYRYKAVLQLLTNTFKQRPRKNSRQIEQFACKLISPS